MRPLRRLDGLVAIDPVVPRYGAAWLGDLLLAILTVTNGSGNLIGCVHTPTAMKSGFSRGEYSVG
jgi:hypothetical protein